MKVLATYGIKGGVGKTSTAVNMAYLAARDGQRVLLWDLDPQASATFLLRVKPRVLMVTGAYFPETSGGGLQARTVIRALRRDADFVVLTTSADPSLPDRSDEDGIPIRRVHVDVQSTVSKLTAAIRFTAARIA